MSKDAPIEVFVCSEELDSGRRKVNDANRNPAPLQAASSSLHADAKGKARECGTFTWLTFIWLAAPRLFLKRRSESFQVANRRADSLSTYSKYKDTPNVPFSFFIKPSTLSSRLLRRWSCQLAASFYLPVWPATHRGPSADLELCRAAPGHLGPLQLGELGADAPGPACWNTSSALTLMPWCPHLTSSSGMWRKCRHWKLHKLGFCGFFTFCFFSAQCNNLQMNLLGKTWWR